MKQKAVENGAGQEIAKYCNLWRINLRKDSAVRRPSFIEVPGIRPQNRSNQPSASGYHFDNGVVKVILPLTPGAAAIMQRYSFSLIHVINDHIESRSTNGYPGYTYVPAQL